MFGNKLSLLFISRLFCLSFLLLAGCEKVTYEEALPEIEFISAQMIDDETAEITGKVINEGGSPVKYTGFSFSTKPNTGMEDNQVVLDGMKGIFKTQVTLMPDSTYYFRCFAVNEFGYKLSGINKLSVPHPQPKIAPCTIAENKIEYYGRTYPIASIYAGTNYAYAGEYGIDLSNYQTGGPRIRIDFNKIPTNGIYITNDNYSLFERTKNKKEVYVRIEDNTEAISGDSVYVNEGTEGKITISFCRLKTSQSMNTPQYIKCKFTYIK